MTDRRSRTPAVRASPATARWRSSSRPSTSCASVGYDRLTFDAVAAAARASKATLYRRWPHKRDLVIDAVGLFIDCPAEQDPDTGSLRGDLLAQACADGGLDDEVVIGTWSALLPVIHREPELARGIHERFLAPKIEATRTIFEHARRRGEVGADADLDTLLMILPSLSIHEALLSGKPTRAGPHRRVRGQRRPPGLRRHPRARAQHPLSRPATQATHTTPARLREEHPCLRPRSMR